ncbi:MAG: uL15 family ribosomal protein [Candidatus Woesearchaeota archaeon]
MTVNKRKKAVRYRGSMTHGKGSKKKRRGSGNKGGKGMAGSGKRADSKKPSLWKEKYFGKYGFVSKNTKDINIINIKYLDENILKLPSDAVSKDNDFFSVDLKKLGFDKLLSKGRATNKYKITVPYASKKAIEKIKAKGGEVILVK